MRKIDSLRNKKHVRHEVVSIDSGGWAHTKCKRNLITYVNADDTSYFYTDGTRYAWPCRVCLPEEFAALKEQDR